MRICLLLYLILSIPLCHAQSSRLPKRSIDSLQNLLKTADDDTNKVNIILALGGHYLEAKDSADIALLEKTCALAERLQFTQGTANCLHMLALAYSNENQTGKALGYYERSLKLNAITGNKNKTARTLNNLGNLFYHMANYEQATRYHLRALKIREEIKDLYGMGASYMNLGIATDVTDHQGALDYYFKALEINRQINEPTGIARCLDNIGSSYKSLKQYDKAIDFLLQALAIKKELGIKRSTANTLNNIGTVYLEQGSDYGQALEYLQESMKLKEEVKDLKGLANGYINTADVYNRIGNPLKSAEYYTSALAQCRAIGHLQGVMYCYRGLAVSCKQRKLDAAAYDYLQKFIALKDSLQSTESDRSKNSMKILYDTEKKSREIAELNRDKEMQNATLAKQKIVIASVIAGLALVVLLAFFIYRGYRQKHLAHMEISAQKLIIEEKNKEVTDSINYARKIQEAILPAQELKHEIFPDTFVLFHPRDIVSGDFYWFTEKNGHKLIAAVDCTGHGVPGAFMSMIGNAFLNEIVNEKGNTSPAAILGELRTVVIHSLKQGEARENKDGMDIALLSFSSDMSRMEYAGANNPLWRIRTENRTPVLEVFEPNKRPIGYYLGKNFPFEGHSLPVQKGDTFYIFTDGFADQFGGPKGKKFKYRQLKELLLSIQHHTMPEQERLLRETFNNWKGELEQVDDVLVIGVRV